jgi:uncharacterized membrane protein HdeD (DUF308 family)
LGEEYKEISMPPFVYAKAFWQALSYLVAGLVGLLAFFNVIPDTFAYSAAVLETAFLAVLKFFDIVPELRARGLLK